jgi:hypothetical protein
LKRSSGDRLEAGKRLKTVPAPPSASVPQQDRETYPSEAFFGLVRQGNDLWAVGLGGIYRVHKDGVDRALPLPMFKQVGSTSVSFDLPNLVLVVTQINRRYSVSGGAPILVPR